MHEIRLCSKYKLLEKRIGKLVVTREWQECDEFIVSKAIPFEGTVFDIQRAGGKGKKVTAPKPIDVEIREVTKEAIEDNQEAIEEAVEDLALYDESGNVVDESIMLVPEEPKEEPTGPEEIEGVKVIETEAPAVNEVEESPKPEKPKKAKKKGGKSGKKKR